MNTKYALVPVVLSREAKQAMVWKYEEAMGGERLPDGEGYDYEVVTQMFDAAIAAAPKELPEEVVERAADAYLPVYLAYPYQGMLKNGEPDMAHRAGIRAALLAVMGASHEA